MKNGCKGSMTIFLALLMMFFLSFCLVLVEGARVYYLRVKAEQAMELAEFSVLSEYQQELLEHYGVFFIDLDYEQGWEHTEILKKRIEDYLCANASQLKTEQLQVGTYRRATDYGGIPFFKQAVEKVKVENGYKIFEELLDQVDGGNFDIGEILEKNETEAESILARSVDDNGTPLFDVSLPPISLPSVEALMVSVFGNLDNLSLKTIDLEERLLERPLEKGMGRDETIGITEMQLFHRYLFEKFHFYGEQRENVWKETLEYQLEYIVSGETEDLRNLENIMWRIFLLRAGGDYLFYHQDAEKLAAAKAEALAIAGVSGNVVLINAVQELILISKAIESAIQETKSIFAGEKVPLYKDGVFSGITLGYEEYLYVFLNMTKTNEKIYRCLDIVEMEIRKKSGYEEFRIDHCVDYFEVNWTYGFESLFMKIPFLNGSDYENTMKRKFYYER